MTDDKPIPRDEFETIVRSVPIVSVDLIVRYDGGVVLGRRENEPAKGEWFVPGGTVLKNERLTDAVHRVAEEELGCDVEIVDSLGAFEHFYDASEFEDVDSKHYVASAFLVNTLGDPGVADDQHGDLRVIDPATREVDDLHPYVRRYLDAVDW